MNEVKVKQIMTRLVVTLSPEETIHEAAAKLAANGISGAPVVEDDKVIGMVSESDIIHAVAPVFPRRRRSVLEILLKSRNLRPAHPPWGPLVGIVSRADIVRAMGRPDGSIRRDVIEMLHILGPEGSKTWRSRSTRGLQSLPDMPIARAPR